MTCDGFGHRLVNCCGSGAIRILPVPAGDGATHIPCKDDPRKLTLCECCFNHEIEWRVEQNTMLLAAGKFDIPKWEDLKLADVHLRVPHPLAGKSVTLTGRNDGSRVVVQDWYECVTGHCLLTTTKVGHDAAFHDFNKRYDIGLRVQAAYALGGDNTAIGEEVRNAVIVTMNGKDVILTSADLEGAV